MFYKDESCKPLMQQLLREFIQHSFKVFENVPQQNFSNISDTMETFFGCSSQIVKKIPQTLEDKTIAYDRLVYYAQRCMTLPESGAIRTSIQFMTHFLMQSRNHPHITEVILATGEQTLYTVMTCVGYLTPRSQVDKFADVFLAMNKKYPAEMAIWLKTVMATPNFPTELISDAEKTRYTTLIIK